MQLPNFPVFANALHYATNDNGIAIADVRIQTEYSYKQLLQAVGALRKTLLRESSDLQEKRIAILAPSGFAYVVCQWAIWAAGGVAVPLCTTHPFPEQLYSIQDSQASLLLIHPLFQERGEALAKEATIPQETVTEESLKANEDAELPTLFDMDINRRALIIFTSGTTGKPKGAVSTHKNISAQTRALVRAWHWTASDRIHHILPLHHVHGIINALTCPLYAGATVEMHQKFDPVQVWDRWLAGYEKKLPMLTTFMSVPTVYSKLISRFSDIEDGKKPAYSEACKQFRFMVSGSASLPNPVREHWRKISSGQVLLERYGMTEIGMGLSQPYDDRAEGTVGVPLEGVEVRLMAETEEGSGQYDKDITDTRGVAGMLQIKGDNVFSEYWQRPEATAKEFTSDGWFRTGDIAMRTKDKGYYQILGRASTDIIKTGGEKVSALEIEREILSCTELHVQDVAVIGVEDPEWGQKVAAVVVLHKNQELDLAKLRAAMKARVAVYKVPQMLKVVDELPKNAMGKVTKKQLTPLFAK